VVTDYYDPLVNPIKAAFNITSGVLSGVLSPFIDEFSTSLGDPGNLKKAQNAINEEKSRTEEARKMDAQRADNARRRFRSK
jgi:hypothetical protein